MRPAAYVGILDAFMMWKCAALPMWKCVNMRDDENTRYEIRDMKYERGLRFFFNALSRGSEDRCGAWALMRVGVVSHYRLIAAELCRLFHNALTRGRLMWALRA